MILRTFHRLALIGFTVLILASVFSAVAAANTVPSSRLGDRRMVINADALKPTQCSAITLTALVICPANGACNGTTANELILGTVNADTIKGNGGNDCIIGGGGDDDLTGNGGRDVCIGGPGNDKFKQCETQIQ